MKVHLAAPFFEDEAIAPFREQFADHAAMRRHRRQAYFRLGAFVSLLADFVSDVLKCRPSGFVERLVFLSGRQGVAPR